MKMTNFETLIEKRMMKKENYDSIGKCLFVIISILLRRWQ